MSAKFDQFVQKYHALVISLIHRYYGGRLGAQAEDLSQEVWTRLWQQFKKNENNIVNFKSYLYRTVQTTLWDAVRALEDTQSTEEFDVDQLGSEAQDDHKAMAVRHLLAQLPGEEARMMDAYLKGFSNGEIAVLLGCSEGRVRNLLTRIKKKLTKMGGN